MLLNLTILPGDGMVRKSLNRPSVLQAVAEGFGDQLQLQTKPIGGAALAAVNDPLPAEDMQACLRSSAVLVGAVGSPAFDHNPGHFVLRRDYCAYGASWARMPTCARGVFRRSRTFFRLRAVIVRDRHHDCARIAGWRLPWAATIIKERRARESRSTPCATGNRRSSASRAWRLSWR